MFRRSEVAAPDGSGPGDGPSSVGSPRRPNLAGDLDTLLEPRPLFRTALRGYDRLQVDNYVSWAEAELTATRRENDDLLARYGTASAELEISRRLLATSPEGRELVRTSERVGEILRLAADEAAQLTEVGATEAERLRGEARSEADTLLRRAREVEGTAVAEAERLREEAQQVRTTAAQELEQARAEADRLLTGAATQRDRLAAEAAAERERLAAEAAAQRSRAAAEAAQRLAEEEQHALAELAHTRATRVAAAQAEVEDLQHRRDEARAALHRLTGQLDDALGVLSTLLVEEARPGHEDPGREQLAS
ncbi:hypothetical protein DQ238_02780 [Geodermatophilus sp. TF02-6]|uniref:hypothetical protein n=1 Tax=Geodermatophilus sp. TF02-6 TaxID=2250575 RepID=UPI000DEB3339|nr:hypothetical protein [Geodermatophilus sp. TF02-6]RBY82941.1 hypothetical protein DQ238_02780 [Geodermatophilus sp. TF02-6]